MESEDDGSFACSDDTEELLAHPTRAMEAADDDSVVSISFDDSVGSIGSDDSVVSMSSDDKDQESSVQRRAHSNPHTPGHHRWPAPSHPARLPTSHFHVPQPPHHQIPFHGGPHQYPFYTGGYCHPHQIPYHYGYGYHPHQIPHHHQDYYHPYDPFHEEVPSAGVAPKEAPSDKRKDEGYDKDNKKKPGTQCRICNEYKKAMRKDRKSMCMDCHRKENLKMKETKKKDQELMEQSGIIIIRDKKGHNEARREELLQALDIGREEPPHSVTFLKDGGPSGVSPCKHHKFNPFLKDISQDAENNCKKCPALWEQVCETSTLNSHPFNAAELHLSDLRHPDVKRKKPDEPWKLNWKEKKEMNEAKAWMPPGQNVLTFEACKMNAGTVCFVPICGESFNVIAVKCPWKKTDPYIDKVYGDHEDFEKWRCVLPKEDQILAKNYLDYFQEKCKKFPGFTRVVIVHAHNGRRVLFNSSMCLHGMIVPSGKYYSSVILHNQELAGESLLHAWDLLEKESKGEKEPDGLNEVSESRDIILVRKHVGTQKEREELPQMGRVHFCAKAILTTNTHTGKLKRLPKLPIGRIRFEKTTSNSSSGAMEFNDYLLAVQADSAATCKKNNFSAWENDTTGNTGQLEEDAFSFGFMEPCNLKGNSKFKAMPAHFKEARGAACVLLVEGRSFHFFALRHPDASVVDPYYDTNLGDWPMYELWRDSLPKYHRQVALRYEKAFKKDCKELSPDSCRIVVVALSRELGWTQRVIYNASNCLQGAIVPGEQFYCTLSLYSMEETNKNTAATLTMTQQIPKEVQNLLETYNPSGIRDIAPARRASNWICTNCNKDNGPSDIACGCCGRRPGGKRHLTASEQVKVWTWGQKIQRHGENAVEGPEHFQRPEKRHKTDKIRKLSRSVLDEARNTAARDEGKEAHSNGKTIFKKGMERVGDGYYKGMITEALTKECLDFLCPEESGLTAKDSDEQGVGFANLQENTCDTHRDRFSGVLTVSAGKKEVYLAPPWVGECLQQQGFADPRHSDYFPDVKPFERKNCIMDHWVKIVVEEGDALVIPYGWLHAVRSFKDTVGFSIKIDLDQGKARRRKQQQRGMTATATADQAAVEEEARGVEAMDTAEAVKEAAEEAMDTEEANEPLDQAIEDVIKQFQNVL